VKRFDQDEDKLAELILYVCQQCADDPCFGATKLNKILYFSDFLQYANTGRPITGVEYQKLEYGPVPRRLLPVRRNLEKKGALGIQPTRLASGAVQQKPVNLRAPDLKDFSGDEIATVDRVIRVLGKMDSSSVSDLSHQMVGWQAVETGETIPYSSILISNPPLTPAEMRRGFEIAEKYGLVDAVYSATSTS
jgi:uncharacterized phage-associated protein